MAGTLTATSIADLRLRNFTEEESKERYHQRLRRAEKFCLLGRTWHYSPELTSSCGYLQQDSVAKHSRKGREVNMDSYL